MALKLPLSNFSLDDVSTVFGSNTRPDRNLSSFHTKIFGNAGAGSKLSNFAGYGRPDCTLVSATTVDDDSVDVVFNISELNNLSAYVRIQYHVHDGTDPFTGQLIGTTIGQNVYGSTGNKTIRVNGLSPSTQYWFRVRYYNEFNDHLSDWSLNPAEYETATTDAAQKATPTNLSCAQAGIDTYTINWDYATANETYVSEYTVNLGPWVSGGLQSSSNWGSTSNPKSGTWARTDGGFFLGGQTVYVRVKCLGSGGTLDSAWAQCQFTV